MSCGKHEMHVAFEHCDRTADKLHTIAVVGQTKGELGATRGIKLTRVQLIDAVDT